MTKENTSHHSPKRKRDEPATPKKPSPSTLRTNFTLGSTIEDEQTPAESPRTQVSNRFEGLQLEGHGVSKLDLLRSMPQVDGGMDDLDKVKKKTKFSVLSVNEIPETPRALGIDLGGSSSLSQVDGVDFVISHDESSLQNVTGKLSKTYPSINRLSECKSRGKPRGSPPPQTGPASVFNEGINVEHVDPDRASLTWHDDEITGFDPDDPDDDGEGIDGVGFRPTAARIELRQQKKRQQLAEYRSRMNKEARAKRFEKRAGSIAMASSGGEEDPDSTRKVRFSEGSSNVMFTV